MCKKELSLQASTQELGISLYAHLLSMRNYANTLSGKSKRSFEVHALKPLELIVEDYHFIQLAYIFREQYNKAQDMLTRLIENNPIKNNAAKRDGYNKAIYAVKSMVKEEKYGYFMHTIAERIEARMSETSPMSEAYKGYEQALTIIKAIYAM